MEKKLTKTEIKRRINEEFYKFINDTYPDWEFDQHGDSGYYTLRGPGGHNEQIDYHIGRQELCSYNNCSNATLGVENDLISELNLIKQKYK